MPCPLPCSNCERKGLPILIARYAAACSAREAGMAELHKLQPLAPLEPRPGGVALQSALYGVRMLRAGYLYLLIEREGAMPEWQGHVVDPHGYLSEVNIRHSHKAKAHPACETDMRGAAKSMVWIPDAQRVEGLWLMFHPDPILYSRLRQIEGQREAYMQKFDVAGWVRGDTGQKHTLEQGKLDSQVMEFAAVHDKSLQITGNEQYFGLMGRTPQEREWGNYEQASNGRHFGQTGGGAATGPAMGPHTETVLQVPYHVAHGARLKNIAELLTSSKGAVVVCDDPIGIAQELSLHHLTAATDYIRWLREIDPKGISNQWKQAASESVKTMRLALSRQAVRAYDDSTESLRQTRDILSGGYPGSDSRQPVRLRRPDGSYEEISLEELNRRRRAGLDEQIGARESDRSLAGVQAANQDALRRTSQYCDMDAVGQFDTRHNAELKKRDDRMDKIAADLQAWLEADALTERALGRYDDQAEIDTGDGARCAGQLCAILLQIDSAPKGREWYATLDLFTPGKKNLVWRMLSLNNAQLSAELSAALGPLTTALPVAGQEVQDAEEKARHEKSYAACLAALAQVSKTLGASDKISKSLHKVTDSSLKRLERLQAAGELAKVVYDSPHAVLGAAAMARFKALPAASGESLIAKAQLLLMARGLGQQAVAFTKKLQADSLSKGVAKQARYTQRQLEKAIGNQVAEVAGKDMRLPSVLLSLNALAILPALANANTKRDERTTTELLGAMAGLMGSMRQWRADLYEKSLYKQLPDMVYKTHKASMAQATEAELLSMKAGAAHFVVAGAIVGVAWDAVDGAKAQKEKEDWLATAYYARVATGSGAIFGAIAGARRLTAPLWLVRFNLVTAIATGAVTITIGKLKGDAWANWLQAQPFRAALIMKEGAPVRVENRSVQPMRQNIKLPYKNEKEMMGKLADALAEIE